MSGGGGGGGGGGSRINDETPCERLRFETQLTSPQLAVTTLRPHDVLVVSVTHRQNVLVVEVLKNGVLVGGLAGPDVTRLRTCIGKGHTYLAVVLAVNGGQVRVRIEHV